MKPFLHSSSLQSHLKWVCTGTTNKNISSLCCYCIVAKVESGYLVIYQTDCVELTGILFILEHEARRGCGAAAFMTENSEF